MGQGRTPTANQDPALGLEWSLPRFRSPRSARGIRPISCPGGWWSAGSQTTTPHLIRTTC
jgi:hypothetical protein